jgi:hypothetical protein
VALLRVRSASEDIARLTRAVIKVQSCARRILARARLRLKRRNWVIKHRLHKAQALIRGHIARVR